jgi:mannitol-1-phosphate/altronate dehydrogenase
MALTGTKTFVGFGFGAIQAGLFLYEAFRSGDFKRLVVAYRRPDVIDAVRRNNGMIAVNIAHQNHIETVHFGPVEMLDTHDAADREWLIAAIAEANELATALSSVSNYDSGIAELLALGLSQCRSPKLIYTAENHNHAAELLQASITKMTQLPDNIQFLNTVIGKMSGVVQGREAITARGLTPVTPESDRAFLVEAFNRILISQVTLPEVQRGITILEEKPDLIPFEEAKLYGHNAVHALAAYLGMALGKSYIRELADRPKVTQFLREAFVLESGASLIKKHAGTDPLFTETGFAAYADDLLTRMVNPYLNDTTERVGRDIPRKLGWDDRLIGTMRLALGQGIVPWRFATGVMAALAQAGQDLSYLPELWQRPGVDSNEQRAVLQLLKEVQETTSELLVTL